MSSPRLYGPSDEPLGEPDPERPPQAVEALIKLEVARQVGNVEREVRRRWRWITGGLAVLAAIFGITSLTFWLSIPSVVRTQLIEPKVSANVSKVISEKAAAFVDTKMQPLDKKVEAAAAAAKTIERDVSAKQKQLGTTQETLGNRLEMEELATAAKSGDSAAYEKVLAAANNPGPVSATANAASREIEMYYDMDAAQLFTLTRVDSISMRDPGFSLDELVVALYQESSPRDREAIVNTIGKMSSSLKTENMGVVGELFAQLRTDTNLRVRARIIHTQNILLKQNFRPLDIAAALKWWSEHSNDTRYHSPYGPLIEQETANEIPSPKAIELLDQTLKGDPNAIYARCIKAWNLISLKRLDEAKDELDQVEKVRSDFRWLLLFRALYLEARGDIDQAVKFLNEAMEKSPSLESIAAGLHEFDDLLANPATKRPSKGSQ